jgi:hypothetical protein
MPPQSAIRNPQSEIRDSSFVMAPHPRPTNDVPNAPEAPFRRLRLTAAAELQAAQQLAVRA